MQKLADKGEGVKNWQNLACVFYGWPLKFNVISVGAPTVASSNENYLIGGNAVTLTCKTDNDDMDTTSYKWKQNNSYLYVYE